MMTSRVAIDATLLKTNCQAVRVPSELRVALLELMNKNGMSNDLETMCTRVSINGPSFTIMTLEEADTTLDFHARWQSCVAIRRNSNVAMQSITWHVENMEITLLCDEEDKSDDDESSSERTCIAKVCFGKDAKSMTIDRCDGKEPEFLLLEQEDTERMVEILQFVRPGTSKTTLNVMAHTQFSERSKPVRAGNATPSFSMPSWFGHCVAVWLSAVVRIHVLYNCRFQAGIERPLCIDNCFLTRSNEVCILSMPLHASTCTCWCGRGSKGKPTVRIVFDHNNIISFKSICKHADCATANFEVDFLRRQAVQTDVFLSCLCKTAMKLIDSEYDDKDLSSELHAAFLESLESSRTLFSSEQLKLNDIIAETMLRAGIYRRKRKYTRSRCEILDVKRTDSIPLKTFEKTALSTHEHLFN